MPIYEYICEECKHEFEIIRPMSQADAKMDCTHCGGNTRRKISVFFAESGGKAVSGMSEPGCGACTSSNCAGCGH